jgi:WD40 repeat protein
VGLQTSTSATERESVAVQVEEQPSLDRVPGVFEVAALDLGGAAPVAQAGIIRRRRRAETINFVPCAVLKTTHGHVYAVAVSPTGQYVASAGGDNHVCVWSPDGVLVHRLRIEESGINALTFSADGSMLAAGGDEGVVHLWLLPKGDEAARVRHAKMYGHTAWISGVSFSKDGRFVATSSFDGTARIWSLEQGKAIQTLSGHQGPVSDICCSPGRTVTVGHDGTVRIWNSQWMQIDLVDGFDGLNSVATDGVTTAWCAANGEVFRDSAGHPRPLLRHRGAARSVAIGTDGVIATAGEDGMVRLYERDGSQPQQSLRTGSPCWSVDLYGKYLAVGCDDGSVHVYRIA